MIAVPTLDAAQVGRNASLHSTETLGAAPSVKNAQPSLVSRPLANSAASSLNRIPGCADPTNVECPGESFCCPAGATCGRDSGGAAICTGGSNGSVPVPNPSATSTTTATSNSNGNSNNNNNNGSGNNNNNGSGNSNLNSIAAVTKTSPSTTTTDSSLSGLNPFKKSAAVSRTTGASGLMVAVAFLGAFLVSFLTPPLLLLNPDPITQSSSRFLSLSFPCPCPCSCSCSCPRSR